MACLLVRATGVNITGQHRLTLDVVAGYKEDSTKGNMLRFEESLPKLPVPTLEATAKRYLKSIHPLLSKVEYEQSKKAVDAFIAPDSLGHTLQKRLLARREDPKHMIWSGSAKCWRFIRCWRRSAAVAGKFSSRPFLTKTEAVDWLRWRIIRL